ncbi:hypothetical protein KAU19_06430 [Candidatus Parcubacteria bacterium]|nr:hypothetical protein [Candidatus Parcubacteria bacterium]
MNRKLLKKATQESRIFKIGNGFFFAAQIPDDSVGGSGSRCTNCNKETIYCHQICRQCKLPFIGPFGFPQLPVWESLTPDEKRTMVEEIYCHSGDRGRLLYTNVEHIPLTLNELAKVERLKYRNADLFLSAHGVAPQKIRENLFI